MPSDQQPIDKELASSLLGAVAPTELVAARQFAHYGAQPLAAAAYALLPMQEDHGHSVLLWDSKRRGFLGRPLRGGGRLSYDIERLRIGYLTAEGQETGCFDLEGQTLGQIFSATAETLRAAGHVVPTAGLGLPNYDLPETPASMGAPFPSPQDPAFAELSAWFDQGHAALARASETLLEGSEVVLWPHHFDLAALLTLPESDPQRFVGAGLSPGDENYAEPYVYVSPYPAPAPELLPELASGAHWHQEGFLSAVLRGTSIVAEPGATPQAVRIDRHLQQSIVHSLTLLGD